MPTQQLSSLSFETHSLSEPTYSRNIRFLTVSLMISGRLPSHAKFTRIQADALVHGTDEPKEMLFK